MLDTQWRDKTNDVFGGLSTFHERYEFLQEDLKVQRQLCESYVDEVKQAETAAATDEAEQWDLTTPGVRQSDRIGEETGSSESAEFAAVNTEVHGRTSTYNLGIDIGLAGTSNNEELNRYEIPERNILN